MRISSTQPALSGRNEPPDAGREARRDYAAVGQKPARVVEEDDAVAQQAPPLLRVEGDGVSRVMVRAVSWRAPGPVWTHRAPLDLGFGRTWTVGARLAGSPGRVGDWFCEDSTSRGSRGRHPKVHMPGESFAASPGTKVPPGLATDAALAAQPGEDEVLLVFDYDHLIDAQPCTLRLSWRRLLPLRGDRPR